MKFGFIGCGNMGSAMARAAAKAIGGENLILANRTLAKAEALARELGANVGSNQDAAACDYVFLCVKPHLMGNMLLGIREVLAKNENVILVSVAAGLTMVRLREMAGGDYPVIRLMPNTPASIGEGMIQYCSLDVAPEREMLFLSSMGHAGRLDAIEETLIDAASCVSGCGPAFAAMFLEALADGGVACGLPRQKAMEYAAQMLVGFGKLYLETGKHPGELKDAVCSPGGSTIQGVRTLEEHGFRAAVTNAVITAHKRNMEMSKM